MEERMEKLEQVLEEIEKVTGLFYQQKANEGFKETNILIGMLMELEQIMNGTDYDVSEWARGLTEAMEALESKDTVLFADILQYDIADQIRSWMLP